MSLYLFAAVFGFIAYAIYNFLEYRKKMYWQWDDGQPDPPDGPGRHLLRTDITVFNPATQQPEDNLKFPYNDFLWGVATAAHQIEGGNTNNQWADWEEAHENGRPRTKDRSGIACDHWNRYHTDIGLMKDLGLNAYRFSIEWSRIEPQEGVWNQEAIERYHKILDALNQAQITPMATLFHFTEPKWFRDKGSWEDEKNIDYYVRFASLCMKEYGRKVKWWCTINEPAVYVTGGWISGTFPPGKRNSPLAGTVLMNLMKAHVKCYKTLKGLKDGPGSQIGIVKNIFQFDPAEYFNPLDHYVAGVVDGGFNESILEFFRTGHFNFNMKPISEASWFDDAAPHSNDFIGLNYYSHYLVKFNFKFLLKQVLPFLFPGDVQPFILIHPEGQTLTDMPHTMYPEGIYRALDRISTLQKPIIITENGIADAYDDRRQMYLRRYLYSVSKWIEHHQNTHSRLLGYFYWTLMDNFEWAEGYTMKFGLYETNFQTQERKFRAGSQFFKDVVHHFRNLKRAPARSLARPDGCMRIDQNLLQPLTQH